MVLRHALITQVCERERERESYIMAQESYCIIFALLFIVGQQSLTKRIFRRHTSPSLVIPHQSHLYNSHNPFFLSSTNLHRRFTVKDVSNGRSVRLPVVQATRPIHQNLLHAIRRQTTQRDISVIPINGPNTSLDLISQFAVIGHKVVSSSKSCPVSIKGTVIDSPLEERNTIIKRSTKKSSPHKYKQKKVIEIKQVYYSNSSIA